MKRPCVLITTLRKFAGALWDSRKAYRPGHFAYVAAMKRGRRVRNIYSYPSAWHTDLMPSEA